MYYPPPPPQAYYPQGQPMMPPQPSYQPPPPQHNPAAIDPLDADDDDDILGKPAKRRDMLNFENFDPALLKKIPGTKEFFPLWMMQLDVAITLLVLFNSITTIMIIIAQFIDRVPNEETVEFGRDNYQILKWTLIIIPLISFLMLVLMVNNYYSRATFYFYLERGAIIDFPESSSPKYIFTHLVPWIFIILFVFFFILVVYMMAKFNATTGQIIIVCTNLVIGVAAMWYKLQSIEDKFITISQFLQKFPDSTGEYNNMDSHSLDLASKAMNNLILLKTEHPCWGNTMRHRWWKEKNWTLEWMIGVNVLIFVAVAILAGVGIGFYYMSVREDEKKRWKTEIAPCVRACQAALSNGEGIPIDQAGKGLPVPTPQWLQSSCQMCICLCTRRFYVRHTIDSLCKSGLEAAIGTDSEFDSGMQCVGDGYNYCPDTAVCKNTYSWYDPLNTTG